MDLLNRLSAKQLIFVVLIVGFLFYNLDSNSIVLDFFSSMKERFNITKKLNDIESEINKQKNSDIEHKNENQSEILKQ